jgi:hypothetical protein
MNATMKFLKKQMKESTGQHWNEEISTARFLVTYFAAWFAGLLILSVGSLLQSKKGDSV